MKMDYHLHTIHSMDGKQTVRALCEAAIDKGLDEICLTEHIEPGHPATGVDLPPDKAALLADVAEAKALFPSLSIRLGIEIGDNAICRPQVLAWLNAWPLDYRLLSLHLVDEVDPYGMEYFAAYPNQRAAYRAYTEACMESVLAWNPSDYDALAHIGYVAKFAPYPKEDRPLTWAFAPDHFEAILRRLAESGKALEINTSGIPRMGSTIPGKDLLLKFRAFGGEFVMLGSDAHRESQVGAYLEEGRDLALSCGFRYTLSFSQRTATPILLEGGTLK